MSGKILGGFGVFLLTCVGWLYFEYQKYNELRKKTLLIINANCRNLVRITNTDLSNEDIAEINNSLFDLKTEWESFPFHFQDLFSCWGVYPNKKDVKRIMQIFAGFAFSLNIPPPGSENQVINFKENKADIEWIKKILRSNEVDL